MRKWVLVAICALAAAGLVTTAAVAHTHSFATSARIVSGGPSGAEGKIGCPDGCPKSCKSGRTVKLFLKVGPNRILMGSDKTNAKGEWDINAALTAGDYHAEVTSKTIKSAGHKHTCKKGKSKKKHL